jgi:hypothetical protein
MIRMLGRFELADRRDLPISQLQEKSKIDS